MRRKLKNADHTVNRRTFGAAAIALLAGVQRAWGQATEHPLAPEIDAVRYLTTHTGGGKQFWADVWLFHDLRIQRHALTQHCRLLDGKNCRLASGTYEECREELDRIRQRDNIPAMQGRAIVVLHGLFRNRGTMERMHASLAAAGGYSVFSVGYPTTRGSVVDHASSLDSVVNSLEGISEINFVAHSLGNLVVRHWLHDMAGSGRALPAAQKFGRMVMLAPPNHQPRLATKLVRGSFAEFIAGPAAKELANGWQNLEPNLATPGFEFGILAGGRGDDRGYNLMLPGDDDAVVTVESTRLVGARDFRVFPVLHSVFMNDPKVQECTLRFLNNGYFESPDTRQPV